MNNEEKAKKITDRIFESGFNTNRTFYDMAKNAAMTMAQWKDEQVSSTLSEAFNCIISCQDHKLSTKEHQYIDLDIVQDIIESFFHIKLDSND